MRQLLLLLSFISILLFFSCGESENSTNWNPSNGSDTYERNSGTLGLLSDFSEEADYAYETVQDQSVPPPAASAPQEISQKIIKTATLRYQSQDLEKTKQQVASVIQQTDGYIQSDNSGKDYNQIYHRITVRVPTKNFQKALDGIAQGVAYFDERTISQQDVTEEFVDLNARLKAKRALEDRYLDLLAKAKNVKEMLEIERELSKIREEIEAKEGRLKYLNSQVSLSTLYIHFYKVTADEGVTQSYGSKIVNALKSGWNGISVFFLGLLHLWPFLILASLGVFFVRRWIRRKKK